MQFHPLWIVGILVVVLIIFGPGRLPELGSAAGKAMREFRKATSELTESITATPSTPAAAPPAPPAEPTPPAASTTAATGDGAAKSTEPASSTKN
jgi:TatA/E family protein of Tat protein translocase